MLPQVQNQHRVAVVLSVREVTLEIKFPCRLRVGITIGKGETLSAEEAELSQGLAVFKQNIRSQVLIGYNRDSKKYSEKKAIITVYVVSSRGRNVAGIYCTDLATVLNKVNQEVTIKDKLQRCPDKQATLSLRIRGFFQDVSTDPNVSMTSSKSGVFDSISSRVHSTSNEGSRVQKIDYNVFQPHSESNSQQKNLYKAHQNQLGMSGILQGGKYVKTVEDILSERSSEPQRHDRRGYLAGRDSERGQTSPQVQVTGQKLNVQSNYIATLSTLGPSSKQMTDGASWGTPDSVKERLEGKLRDAMSDHESERVSILGEVSKLKNQIMSDGVYKSRFEQELKDLNGIIQQKGRAENQLKLQLEQAATNTNRSQRLLAEKTRQASVLTSKLLELQTQTQTEASRMNNQIQVMRLQLESERGATQRSKLECLQVLQKLSLSEGLSDTITKKCLALEATIRQSEAQNKLLEGNLGVLAEQRHSYEVQLERLDGIIQDYSHRLTSCYNQQKTSQTDVRRLNQSLGVAIKQSQKDTLIWEDEVKDLKTQLSQQQDYYIGQLQKAGQSKKKKQEQLLNILESQTDWQLSKVQLQAGEADLRESLRQTESQLNAHKSQVQILKRTISNLQQEESSLKQELNQLSRNLEDKAADYDCLSEANETLELTVVAAKKEINAYKDAVNQHIQSLLRCLFNQSKGEQPSRLEGLSDNIYKQQVEVVTNVRGCYRELETLGGKLVAKEMQCVDMEQNYELKLCALKIDLERSKRLPQTTMHGGNSSPDCLVPEMPVWGHKPLMNGSAAHGQLLARNQSPSLTQKLERENQRLLEELKVAAEQRQQLERRMTDIQREAVTTQKELYYQYGETNLMNLKNAQYLEAIRELEDRIQDAVILQNQLELDKTTLEMEAKELRITNAKLSQERRFSEQRQRVILQENQFLRVQCNKSGSHQQNQYAQQSKVTDSGGLAGLVLELQAKVRERETVVSLLQENVKLLGDEIGDKYSKIYALQEQLKQLRGKFRDHSRSRNNISRSRLPEPRSVLASPTMQETVRSLIQGTEQLLRQESNDLELARVCSELQGMLRNMPAAQTLTAQ